MTTWIGVCSDDGGSIEHYGPFDSEDSGYKWLDENCVGCRYFVIPLISIEGQ